MCVFLANTQQSTIKIFTVCNQANCDPQLHYQQPIYQSQQTHPTLMYKQQLQQQSEYADLSQSHLDTQRIYQSQQTLFPPHQSLPAPQYVGLPQLQPVTPDPQLMYQSQQTPFPPHLSLPVSCSTPSRQPFSSPTRTSLISQPTSKHLSNEQPKSDQPEIVINSSAPSPVSNLELSSPIATPPQLPPPITESCIVQDIDQYSLNDYSLDEDSFQLRTGKYVFLFVV